MDFLLEMVLTVILEPILTILIEAPIETAQSMTKNILPKWLRIALLILFIIAFLAVIAAIIVGAVLTARFENELQKTWGIILLSSGITLFVGYITYSIIRYIKKDDCDTHFSASEAHSSISEETKQQLSIGQRIHIEVDRPLGSVHPDHADIVYEVNYGFAPGYYADDGEYQDAYILGIDVPIEKFDGVLVAIIHRHNDNEDKWVVAPEGYLVSNEEIIEKTNFQEKYFDSTLIR